MTHRFICILTALAIAGSVAGAALAAEPMAGAAGDNTDSAWWEQQLKASGFTPVPGGKEWWRAIVAQNPSCSVVSNGCQTCFAAEDRFTCSNPGFACIDNDKWTCGPHP